MKFVSYGRIGKMTMRITEFSLLAMCRTHTIGFGENE